MSFTVVPLHNLDLPAGSRIPFGKYFVLQDVPEWLKQDKSILNDIGRTDRHLTLAAKHALVSEYDADSLGFPDPDWKGPKPRSIQKQRFQTAFLANMAIWLVQPSEVSFTVGFHALTRLDGGRTVDPPFIIPTEREGPYYCHPKDAQNPVLPRHVIKAAKLCELLEAVPRKNAVWAALRAIGEVRAGARRQRISLPTMPRINSIFSTWWTPATKPDPELSTAGGTKARKLRTAWPRPNQSSEPSFATYWKSRECLIRSSLSSETISLRRGCSPDHSLPRRSRRRRGDPGDGHHVSVAQASRSDVETGKLGERPRFSHIAPILPVAPAIRFPAG